MTLTFDDAHPHISVCIPVHNRTSYLRACLASVRGQTFEDFEIVVVDNASDEPLEATVAEFGDRRIRYYRNEVNIGPVANFIMAASYARGELLKFVCSDDLLRPNCIEVCSREMDRFPDAGAAVFRSAFYDERADVLKSVSVLPFQGLALGLEVSSNKHVYHYTSIAHTSTVFRRSAFEALGGFDKRLDAVIDWDIYAKMLRTSGGVLFVNQVLAITRIHDSNEATHQARTGGFFRDMLRIAQGEGRLWELDVSDAIWRELMQHRTDGEGFRILRDAAAAGFLPQFAVSVPRLALRHLWRGIRARTFGARSSTDSLDISPADSRSIRQAWHAARLNSRR